MCVNFNIFLTFVSLEANVFCYIFATNNNEMSKEIKQENLKLTTINEERLKARSKEIKTLKAVAAMTLLGLKPTSKYHK